MRFFFCRFLLESAAGLFLVCVAAPRLSIWIFTFQKFRLEDNTVKYAPRKVYIKESGGYAELSYTDFCRRRESDQTYMDKLFIPIQGCLLEVFPCRFLLPVSYLLNPFLPPVSERDYALSANFLLWSSYHNNLSCACHIPVDHTKTFIKCLYHLAISDVYCHMANVLISSVACKTVEDKVSRL